MDMGGPRPRKKKKKRKEEEVTFQRSVPVATENEKFKKSGMQRTHARTRKCLLTIHSRSAKR